MKLPEVYVLRHGETEWNRIGRWQGHLDSPLTAEGRAQARAVGALLHEMGVGPQTHTIWSSPQGRALETARLAFGVEPRVDDRLREIGVGGWAGRLREELLAEAGLGVSAPFLELYRRAPGGEPFEALHARARAFLARLDAPAVIVTHGITSRFLRAAALGLGPERSQDLPGGQGVVHHIRDGVHRTLCP